VALVYGVNHAATASWGDAVTLAWLAAGLALIVIFLLIEFRSPHALIPFHVLASRNRATSYLAMMALGSTTIAMFYFTGLYIQTELGVNALIAGLEFIPFNVGVTAGSLLASSLLVRVDARWIASVGALLDAVGIAWLSRLSVESSFLGGLLGPMLLLSFGIGLAFVPLTVASIAGVREADSGVASAVLSTVQQVGGALGLAALSTAATFATMQRAGELLGQLRAWASSGRLSRAQIARLQSAIGREAFTHGTGVALLIAAVITGVAALIIYAGLRTRDSGVAADDTGAVATH
jgi:hypothetical protein